MDIFRVEEMDKMTTHEMAKILLEGPDVPVLMEAENEDGGLRHIVTRDGKFPVSGCVPGDEDARWDESGELRTIEVVILCGTDLED